MEELQQEMVEMLENIATIIGKNVIMGSTIVITESVTISAYITVSAYGYKTRVVTITNLDSKATLEIAYSAATKKRIEAAILLFQ